MLCCRLLYCITEHDIAVLPLVCCTAARLESAMGSVGWWNCWEGMEFLRVGAGVFGFGRGLCRDYSRCRLRLDGLGWNCSTMFVMSGCGSGMSAEFLAS